jgi:hypothetical protein
VGPENGEFLQKEFYPDFDRQDLVAQDKYHIYLKLAIDGKQSQPFSAFTLSPFYNFQPQGNRDEIVDLSRVSYCAKGEESEKETEQPCLL